MRNVGTRDFGGEVARQVGFFRQVTAAIQNDEHYFPQVLNALPVAVYITDAQGVITYYNEAAAALWGQRPVVGKDLWCGAWKLYWPDGEPLPHDQCPMAMALRDGQSNRGYEIVAERPNGDRVSFVPYPTLLYDAAGAVAGVVSTLVDISDRKHAEAYAQQLASIVEFSDDAIVSKDLDGIIKSWNRGAERLFGYTAREAIGKSVTILIPPDRLDEETRILERIRKGMRVSPYETLRQRKDGSLVHISLTVSPLKSDGKIIGASKIARDITDRKRAEEQQSLLLREMNHRVKNAFALAASVVTLSARSASTSNELTSAVHGRLGALARAHDLTLPKAGGSKSDTATTLHALIQTIVSPFDSERVHVTGPDVVIAGSALTSFALLLHEFATNAAKYGAFSTPAGSVAVDCSEAEDKFVFVWTEHGGPTVDPQAATNEGFGSLLARTTVAGQLGGEFSRDWRPEGLTIRLTLDRSRLAS